MAALGRSPVLVERPGWRRASAWGALYWVVIYATSAARLVGGGGYGLAEAVRAVLPQLVPALALTPAVLWLAGRFPLERPRVLRHVGLHLGASFGLLCVGAAFRRVLILSLYPITARRGPFWAEYPTDVRDGLRYLEDYWLILGVFYAFVYFRRWQAQRRHAAALEEHLARVDEVEASGAASPPPESDADSEASGEDGTAPHRLLVRSGKKRVPVTVEDIRWVEAEDYCVRVRLHLAGGRTLLYRRSLKDLEAALPADGPGAFARVHRSTLVRLEAVREVARRAEGSGYDMVLDDGTRRRVSRSRRAGLLAALEPA